ncbi:uncharacterized protein LOC129590493 [Paramacrobiotus metropolitanus]|uniref:uncharacterized protein LOC129590493 n=1 Tax=Paramacrobiotus metropolitanus TaxID=2943436 RepID=UPI0024460871|nr:uncharacterized protein LOC129590493 [Paramacrobiotus metropolitanus]
MSSAFSMFHDDSVAPASPTDAEQPPTDLERLMIQRISQQFEKFITESEAGQTTIPPAFHTTDLSGCPSHVTFPPPPTRPVDPRPLTPQKAFVQPVEEWLAMAGAEPSTPGVSVDEAALTLITDFLLSDHLSDLAYRVYEVLLYLLRSRDDHHNRFFLQLYPALIWRYFLEDGRPGHSAVAALLLAVYCLGTTDETGQPRVSTFVMPSMNYSSLYHRAQDFPRKVINEINREVPTAGTRVPAHSYPFIEGVNRSTRWLVFSYMTRTLTEHLAHCNKACHRSIITITQRLLQNSIAFRLEDTGNKTKPEAKRGTASGKKVEAIAAAIQALKPNLDKLSAHLEQLKEKLLKTPPTPPTPSRIHFPASFLVDWTNLLYVLMYQGYFDEAYALVQDIQREAEFRALPDVLLITGAVLNRAQTTVAASSFEEVLPRVDVHLADVARKDLQNDISIVAQNVHRAAGGARRKPLIGGKAARDGDDIGKDICQLIEALKINDNQVT